MNPMDPNRNDRDPTVTEAADDQDEACLLYLLDELDVEGRRRFETRLANEPKLGDQLLRQADLISALSRTPSRSEAPIAIPATQARPWRWIAAAAAIAACIALAFQIAQMFSSSPSLASRESLSDANRSPQPMDEATLIAQAWASSQNIGQTLQEPLADLAADDPYDAMLEDPTSDIDSKVSWMFIAITSSDEMQTEGGNDG
jgi:hypothetical protein